MDTLDAWHCPLCGIFYVVPSLAADCARRCEDVR